MSLLPLAAKIRAIAQGHRRIPALLSHNGNELVKEFRSNIDRSQNAGPNRPSGDTSGTVPRSPMAPLAKYTVAKRNAAGIHHDHPLKATGRMYREIGIRGLTSQQVTAGGVTARARKLIRFNWGSNVTGQLSSDLGSIVPPRTPIGYSNATADRILKSFGDTLSPSGSVQVVAGVTIIL